MEQGQTASRRRADLALTIDVENDHLSFLTLTNQADEVGVLARCELALFLRTTEIEF